MIYLFTGLPGAGKTLRAVTMVPKMFEGREIYYYGINDLSLPWQQLEKPEDWHKCPDGSVIVIDEAQKCFRERAKAGKVPPHVEALETHRHHGFDLVLITQHPGLLDSAVKHLTGFHEHMRRTWGMHTSKVFRHDRVFNVTSQTELNEANQVRWQYPKSSFGLYKSAEIHTHKVRLPNKVFLAGGLLLLLGACGYYLYKWADGVRHPKGSEPVALVAGLVGGAAPVAKPVGGEKAKAPATYEEWTAERRPVAPEDVSSSARYFPLTTAVRAPRVAGCVRTAERCQCFTQQATIIRTSDLQCAEVMANLHFQDWGPGGESGLSNQEDRERDETRRREERDRSEAAAGASLRAQAAAKPGTSAQVELKKPVEPAAAAVGAGLPRNGV